jgi:hypothetical protein
MLRELTTSSQGGIAAGSEVLPALRGSATHVTKCSRNGRRLAEVGWWLRCREFAMTNTAASLGARLAAAVCTGARSSFLGESRDLRPYWTGPYKVTARRDIDIAESIERGGDQSLAFPGYPADEPGLRDSLTQMSAALSGAWETIPLRARSMLWPRGSLGLR